MTGVRAFPIHSNIQGGFSIERKQTKAVPTKRIQFVDVVLERKGSQLFSGRRVRSPEDAANIIRDFIGDRPIESYTIPIGHRSDKNLRRSRKDSRY